MLRQRNRRPALMLRVMAELGKGRVTECSFNDPGYTTEGFSRGRHVWVSPHQAVVNSCIHELLHRMYSEWSEAYVRNRTTYLVNRMTDEEVRVFYETFQSVARKRKRPMDSSDGE